MDLSILVAKLYGAILLAFGLGLLFNSTYYKKTITEMLKDKGYILFGGMFALIIGLLLVMNHNIWEWSWVVIITIVGWIALIKGILLIVYPQFASWFEGWFNKNSVLMFMGAISLILGGVLTYFGWYV
ncbi:hypothetical protein J7J83_01805 [bacterium]|nr:hypothetical protein [bacterium]